MKILTVLFFAIITHSTAYSQALNLNPKEWAEKLADPSDKENKASLLLNKLFHSDSLTVFNFLNKLKSEPSAQGHYFLARYNCFKAMALKEFNPPDPIFSPFLKDSIKREVTKLLEEAMRQAFIVDDDYLAAYVSSVYAGTMATFQDNEKAVMYMTYSADLYSKTGLSGKFSIYTVLGEMLWRVKEYQKSIEYSKKAIPLIMESAEPYKHLYLMMCYNTIALAYHRLKNYDSAVFYYHKAIPLTSLVEVKKTGVIWYGIILGNMAQIDYAQGKYDKALSQFVIEYKSSNENGVYDDAANSLQWAAKTNLALGNKTLALQQIRESFILLKKWPHADNYRQNAFQTAAEIFKASGNNDSAYYYSGKYNLLHDSLEKSIYESSIGISQLRLNNEKNRYNIQRLEQQKSDRLQRRNYLIAAILFIFVIVLLLINRQRQKLKFKSKMDEAETARIRGEIESARTQLKIFTENIVEKSNLIEKLEAQVKNKIASQEEKDLIQDLSHQTILTEEDWLGFKTLFEKIHPDFFLKINKQVDNITQAEQRMAALTLLRLTTKQMAAVLGISPNSVIKAKQRLRQRLNLESDKEVEKFIVSL